jgi:hypothetical protein
MARTRPTGSSGGSSRHTGGTHTHRHKTRHPRAHHPRAKRPHTPKADTRGPTPEPLSARSVWPRAATLPGAVRPLTALAPGALASAPPLALTGAQPASLHTALAAWTRERDQSLSRVSRRPGALSHLAGT